MNVYLLVTDRIKDFESDFEGDDSTGEVARGDDVSGDHKRVCGCQLWGRYRQR